MGVAPGHRLLLFGGKLVAQIGLLMMGLLLLQANLLLLLLKLMLCVTLALLQLVRFSLLIAQPLFFQGLPVSVLLLVQLALPGGRRGRLAEALFLRMVRIWRARRSGLVLF
jgi:hypothetical protein